MKELLGFKRVDFGKKEVILQNHGDIIFFDWENDGHSDHVGIVERVENGCVYTVEGNTSGDVCKENVYGLDSGVIFGYGTPIY